MRTFSPLPPHIRRKMVPVPGFPRLSVCVYGEVNATSLARQMEQGYFVECDGDRLIRAEMLDAEKQAVQQLLLSDFPQHARI